MKYLVKVVENANNCVIVIYISNELTGSMPVLIKQIRLLKHE